MGLGVVESVALVAVGIVGAVLLLVGASQFGAWARSRPDRGPDEG